MGLLNLFSKPATTLFRLPSGSFTVDRDGAIIVGTLPSSFPEELVHEIAEQILTAFKDGAAAQLPLSEIIINYPSLRIAAKELRGGAIVFLTPKVSVSTPNQN
ncbi:MAG TPA: hypothetical protein VLT36_10210 [Candidatus Dormibacteraeota bacterium]|nr:hypothetical protein [Candidatus Dormibacteraeota bacterium]